MHEASEAEISDYVTYYHYLFYVCNRFLRLHGDMKKPGTLNNFHF